MCRLSTDQQFLRAGDSVHVERVINALVSEPRPLLHHRPGDGKLHYLETDQKALRYTNTHTLHTTDQGHDCDLGHRGPLVTMIVTDIV